ncbi:MAG TPA: cupredoxin domain-containing protein [Chloroflexota bacterium]|nr:cupredoxin domain-containing protein [Chloroflexota bacterium]
MSKLANLLATGSASLALAACAGGGASGAPAGGVPASVAAKPSAAAASPSAPAGAAASAQVVGQKAPGPYSANASVTVANGQASIEATDSLKWQPDAIIAKAGDKITLQVKNSGNTAHAFLSPGLSVSQTDVPVQKTTSVTFTAPSAPGAYQFWCNIPGHAEAGMVGEVIVQ